LPILIGWPEGEWRNLAADPDRSRSCDRDRMVDVMGRWLGEEERHRLRCERVRDVGLEEAVADDRDALMELNRKQVPLQWARGPSEIKALP
jgi:hypothetical protein